MTIALNPEALRWAVTRSGIPRERLEGKFASLPKWESGERRPTYAQAKRFAKAVHVPFIRLYMPPPEEIAPIPDLRVIDGGKLDRMSPELIDMIHACQRRQDWYRDYAIANHRPELDFVGSATTATVPREVADDMRRRLGIDVGPTMEEGQTVSTMQSLVDRIEEIGVLVMTSGVVGNNSRRPLDVREFRGFALSDSHAPIVFVNGRDAEDAQMFTLVRGLAHVWLGSSGVTNMGLEAEEGFPPGEVWCGDVAVDLLVPENELQSQFADAIEARTSVSGLADIFGVSERVILVRLLSTGLIDQDRFEAESAFVQSRPPRARSGKGAGGGGFHRILAKRVGQRFGHAVASSTFAGGALHRRTLRLLGISSVDVLMEFGRYLHISK